MLLFAETIQLFPDGTIFIHIAMILAMIWILNRTLYKPINRVLEARERIKGGRSSEAEELIHDAETKESRYGSEMLEARSAGYALIEKEQRKAQADRDKKLAEAKAAAADELAAGRSGLEKQADEVRSAIGTDAEKMADTIAANILKA
jgi:F-type H+-transporting ATPase subunit b